MPPFRQRLVALFPSLLVLQLAGMLTFDYYSRVEAPSWEQRVKVHASIVNGKAPYQYRYRVLIPYVAEGLARTLQAIPKFGGAVPAGSLSYSTRAFNSAFILMNFSALLLLFMSLWSLMETWFERRLALFGLALAAIMIDFTFRDHFYHPWSFWEAAFYALGMHLVLRRRWYAVILLSAVGALCRETTAFLPLGFLLFVLPLDFRRWRATDLRRTDVQAAIASLGLWLGAWLAVHRLVGYAPPTFFLERAMTGNLGMLHYSVLMNVLLLGALPVLAGWGLPRSPHLVRSMAVALVPYIAVLLTIGFWWEIRYWMTLLPVLIPALLSAIEPPRETTASPALS